jgi:antitoxin FitA
MISLISNQEFCAQMGQILIRNVDDAVLDALRRRAAETGTSMEEEARRALTASVGLTREEAIRRLDAVRESIGRIQGPSTLDQLREDRRRDEV